MKESDNCAAHSVGRHLLSHGKTTDRSHDDVVTSRSADVWPILIYHTTTMSPPEMHLVVASPLPPPILSSPLLLFSTYALQPSRLIVRSGLEVPTFTNRRLHACHHTRAPSGRRWNCGQEMSGNFAFHVTFRGLLHAVKLRHGTDGFSSPPKEGVLRIFSP